MERLHVASLAFLLLLAYFNTAESAKGYGDGEQDWGFVDVREGAHMFYWLYYTTANVTSFTDRPLAIWLQGGPGVASTGLGNFEELGPLTLDGEKREFTWVKDLNVLFIDNPVGTGFSYVDNETLFAKTNKEIALDLVELMKGFYKNHPEFEKVPLHIFSQSYGGKMSPEFALELYKAIKRGEIQSNLKSVLLGDPFTSPIDTVMAWGDFLLNTGFLDYEGYNITMAEARRVQELVNQERWQEATTAWGDAQYAVVLQTNDVDWYNVEKRTRFGPNTTTLAAINPGATFFNLELDNDNNRRLQELLGGPVKKALNISTAWVSQAYNVTAALEPDFMKPAVDIVVELLETTDLQVGVLTGQLDLICPALGTLKFVNDMQWSYKNEFDEAPRVGISVNGVLEGYQKQARNFSFFWAMRAGHKVPADNPAAMDHILRYYTKYDQLNSKADFL